MLAIYEFKQGLPLLKKNLLASKIKLNIVDRLWVKGRESSDGSGLGKNPEKADPRQ